ALDAAQEARPYSLYAYRNRILARMLDGRNDDALALAEKAAARGLVLDLAGHPAFEDLAALPGFAAVAGRMESNAAPVGAPQAVRAFEDSELLPEAIAFGRKGALYIGGVRNGAILSAAKKASSLSTLATAPGGVFDLEARDRTIWAAVNNQLAYEGASGETPFAAIMVFDAKSGDTLRDIRIVEENALLGDLEVAKDGAAYASDSITPRLFRLAPSGDVPEVFIEDPRFVNLQGLALDEANNRLFVADYLAGIFVVDLASGEVRALRNDADAHLGGVDGLYYEKGALIGVQNGTTPQRIVQLSLDENAAAVTQLVVLHQGIEGWSEPTHGALRDGAFHYIATSNWPAYNDDGSVKDGARL
ncbi:MAG: hypothetical protein KAH44_17880, partial [Oricola sp.]|nr:hypothetical protein [Oricola sp.]